MYRFFIKPEQMGQGVVRITGEDVHHICHVLRMRPGEEILVSCGDEWEYTCRLLSLEEQEVVGEILDAQKPGKELPSRIHLFQCLPKGEKMEWIIQKAVELGVYRIIPTVSARCVVKLDPKRAAAKTARWNSVAAAAAKQSKRMILPEVAPVTGFRDALAQAGNLDVCLIPYERADGMQGTRELLNSITPGNSIGILIGPEGGFEEKEVELAGKAGFSPITLGRRILRTETAGITALSVLMYLLEQD